MQEPRQQPRLVPRDSAIFDKHTLAEIRRAAATGIYDIRGFGAKRALPHFDDLLFLGASMSRYPLEGYRERCGTHVTLGARHAKKPIRLKIPITIAGMSFGALSAQAKEAAGRAATIAGTSTTTGDGGMTQEERKSSQTLVYQYLPSRYGMNPRDLRAADAIEIVVGQGAKPGGGGMLLGQKITERIATMRTLPAGIDQRSASRHPDWTGPDDLEIKILELRELTDWEKPIFIKVGASRPYYDTALAAKAGADVVVLDGMQGGTAATQTVFIENVGLPTLAAIRPAVQALQDLGLHRKVQLIVSGGIRNGADVAKALALGADAVSIGTAALVALGDNDPRYEEEYQALGTHAGSYDAWHEGRDPAGITTQDPALSARLDPVQAGRRLANYLAVLTLEAQTIARACGKSHLHNLEPEDLVALTVVGSRNGARTLGRNELDTWSMRALSETARDRGIKFFLIAYTDLFGILRAKLVPARAIDGMAQDGAGFAGFANWFDMTPADPDMLAVPDVDSLIQLPWKPEVGWVAADLHMAGQVVEQAPRSVLKRVVDKAAAQGLEMRTGVEPEFFFIQPDGQAIADPADQQIKPCYDQLTLMRRYDIIAEISNAMETLGWEPYQNDHEDANGQYEMNWNYAPATVTADRHAFFKYMVRSIAEKHGLRATFMPKPFSHLTGSGCHAHVSVWMENKNVFADEKDPSGVSPSGYHFIGGLLAHADALCALTNPVVNSYKRINAPPTQSGATWSPSTVSWGGNNRTHMIRIPAPGRVEYRLADGAANPYLLQAALLTAGLDGINQAISPGKRLDVDMYASLHAGVKRLPLNLLDAVRAFEASRTFRDAMGGAFVAAYTKLKRQEWDGYAGHLTQWERDTTLNC